MKDFRIGKFVVKMGKNYSIFHKERDHKRAPEIS